MTGLYENKFIIYPLDNVINKEILDTFLQIKKAKQDEQELLQSKLKQQACLNLKNNFEIAMRDLITLNRKDCAFPVHKLASFSSCGLDKQIKDIEDYISITSIFQFKIRTEEIHILPDMCEDFNRMIHLTIEPKPNS